jgi:excisionase family DNA binding protein
VDTQRDPGFQPADAERPDAAAGAPGGEGEAEEPVTVAEAARRAGVHPNTVRRLIHRGTLGALMIKGRHGDTWLVDAAELRRLVAESRRQGAPAREASEAQEATPREARDEAGPPGRAAVAGQEASIILDRPARAPSGAAPDDESPVAWEGLPLSGAVDLSLERAQALERYTHGLLTPLVALVRERDAALDRKSVV